MFWYLYHHYVDTRKVSLPLHYASYYILYVRGPTIKSEARSVATVKMIKLYYFSSRE